MSSYLHVLQNHNVCVVSFILETILWKASSLANTIYLHLQTVYPQLLVTFTEIQPLIWKLNNIELFACSYNNKTVIN